MSLDLATSETVPVLDGNLRSHYVRMPEESFAASGIRILGKNIKSIVFSTDLAIVRNCNADAVFAVYPFTPQESIARALCEIASSPVFVGVGGGTTSGTRSAILAKNAEAAGAYGVVLNAPVSNFTVEMVSRTVDIPVIVTVVDADPEVVRMRLEAGASIINVSGGKNTSEIVAALRAKFPTLPIIATGGKSAESVAATVAAGANAVTCTPPSTGELFSPMMERYRDKVSGKPTETKVRPLSDAALREVYDGVRQLREEGLILGGGRF